MRLLLDTHLLIWAAVDSPRLPPAARTAIRNPDAVTVFSAASLWEVAIKHALRRQDFPVPPDVLRDAALGAEWEELPILARHVIEVVNLPPIHGDPFDRLLLAQARVDGMTLVTADATLGRYGDPVRLV